MFWLRNKKLLLYALLTSPDVRLRLSFLASLVGEHNSYMCRNNTFQEFHNAVQFLPIKGFDPAQKLLIVSAVDKDLCVVLD